MAGGADKRSFAQDFFFELMRDSQRVRAVYLAERERWIRSLEISGREEILFELEMLLRGIDRFFNLRNLFGEIQPPQDRDWREELKATRDAVHRSVHLARRLIAQRQEQALLFRSFVEGSLSDDRARARLGAELREQRTPEESLFLLRTGLVAHQGILDHLLRPVRLLEALRNLADEKQRKAFALALLASFRMLRSLRYVPAAPTPHTRRVLVILALVRSEMNALIGYLESDLPRLCATPEGVGPVAAAGRAAAQPVRDVMGMMPPILSIALTDRAQLDEQRDVFARATKDCIGAIARALDPALGKTELFEDEGARLAQSERLRRDLWVFREMCKHTARALSQNSSDLQAAEALRRYATEFRDVGYQLLRHSDRELFDRFLDLLEGWSSRRGESTALRMQRLRDDCLRFADILDRALDLVGKRGELQKLPIDDPSYQQELAKALQWR